jgi:ubiquinone/menaquinone biosynthesis C-methylase UbiE
MGPDARYSLGRDAYYCPTPLLVSDEFGIIRDVNLAFEVIWATLVPNCRGRPIESVLNVLQNKRAINFSDASSLGICLSQQLTESETPANIDCRSLVTLSSTQWGNLDFVETVVARRDALTGTDNGLTYYWQILETASSSLAERRFFQRLLHELVWEMYGASYDRILAKMPYYRLVLRRHRKALAASTIQRIADVGAGTGNLVELLLQDGREVVAIDSSRAMCLKLQMKSWAKNGRLVVLQQSAEYLANLENASFDGVSILLALFDMDAPKSGLQEAIRILRPGGRIVITEPKRTFNRQVVLDRCKIFLRRAGLYGKLKTDMDRVEKANSSLDPTRPGQLPRCFIEHIFATLVESGFENISLRESHYRQCATVTGTKPTK